MLIDFQYVFPHVVLLSLTWVPGHLLHKVCVRLILNVHTSRSCRKYASVAKCIGLWIARVRMARRNFEGVPILLVGTSSRVPVTKNHRNGWYFHVLPGRSMTLTVSQAIVLSCLTVPHIRHTRRFGNPY